MNHTLRLNPARTGGMERRLAQALRGLYAALEEAVRTYLLGGTGALHLNDHSSGKVQRFRDWLRRQMPQVQKRGDALIQEYIDQAYRKGANRAFMDLRRGSQRRAGETADAHALRLQGEREAAVARLAAGKPTVQKVKLLAGRTFHELEDINARMGAAMSRTLADGLIKGHGPERIARDVAANAGLTAQRALLIVRTELVRAHAEGQLDALQLAGENEVTAAVEFVSVDDDRVCPRCAALAGRTYTVERARGVIPVHTRCRCAWVPVRRRRGK